MLPESSNSVLSLYLLFCVRITGSSIKKISGSVVHTSCPSTPNDYQDEGPFERPQMYFTNIWYVILFFYYYFCI